MQNSNMKNIVVLKNLPSNLVDEAIVILKSKKTAKRLEFIEKKSNITYNRAKENKDYVIREAESIISSYISKLEKNKDGKKSDNNIETKYKKIKAYSIFVSIILFFCLIRVMVQNFVKLQIRIKK